jgi:hypothetical protein
VKTRKQTHNGLRASSTLNPLAVGPHSNKGNVAHNTITCVSLPFRKSNPLSSISFNTAHVPRLYNYTIYARSTLVENGCSGSPYMQAIIRRPLVEGFGFPPVTMAPSMCLNPFTQKINHIQKVPPRVLFAHAISSILVYKI